MIKINLANKKQVSYASDAANAGMMSSLKSLGSGELSGILARILIPVGICVGLYFGFEYYIQNKTESMQQEFANLETEKTKIEGELVKIKGFELQKIEIKKTEDAILIKINTVENLIKGRDRTLKELIAIAQSLPKEVWLTDIEGSEDRTLRLKGYATELGMVSDVMSGLSGSVFFKGVNLTKGTTDENTARANFDITARRE
jgi:Tfp pilus assembly protein PilN